MNAGTYLLGDLTITGAGTTEVTPVRYLQGMLAATVTLQFIHGTGGTAVRAYLQTTIDQGRTWIDIASRLFGVTSQYEAFNISKLEPVEGITPTDGSLTDDTTLQGILGDELRLLVRVTGTYGGQTMLTARVNVA